MTLDLAIYLGYNFDPTHPSVRLRRLNLRKPLRSLGINANIIYRYEDLAPFKNILLSHFNKELVEQCKNLRIQGKKLFFCHSENLWGLPYQEEVFNLCDYIVCCSTKLMELTQPRLTSSFTKCVVIEDMAEQSSLFHSPQETDKLKIVYCGMGGNSYLARQIQPIIEALGMELSIISEHSDADIKWNLDTYLSDMSHFDVAICPQNVMAQPAKSAVKVITAMGVGLPTISSPNPAYLEVVKQGENGFIANTSEEWGECLLKLKDFNLRKKMSQAALQTAQNFTPQAIAQKWDSLLSIVPSCSVALINNTLSQKYLSYGDYVLEDLRLNGYEVTEFRYEDIDSLPEGFDLYLFIEVRYNPETISDVKPRILYTREAQNLNNLPHYDLIISEDPALVKQLNDRGFVNVVYNEKFNAKFIFELLKKDFDEARKKHNIQLHTAHINFFNSLVLPEERWSGLRDKQHIDFTVRHAPIGSRVLDVGSADGWLSIFLAKENRQVSALEFVTRGILWAKQQAARLKVDIDLRRGCFEDVNQIFHNKKFDYILAYEILEHLDLLKLPQYLERMEKLLNPRGKILISLPSQDCRENSEHLWSPSEFLIKKIFKEKPNFQMEWASLPPTGTYTGNWYISYQPEK